MLNIAWRHPDMVGGYPRRALREMVDSSWRVMVEHYGACNISLLQMPITSTH